MGTIIGLSGDQAAAYAAKQSNVDVVAAYPITPQTIIVEEFSNYVHNGEVDTEFVCVESEHSAMSACIGASLTGARVFTATASQGLALMHEMLYIASGMRCPVVMTNVNRALSAPINIHNDHSDMMGSRDSGWIQLFGENAQEVYDWTIQAFKIGENKDVLLPVAVNLDGFTISHALENVEVIEDSVVHDFLGNRVPVFKLDPKNPITLGAIALQNYYFEFKVQQQEAMKKSLEVIKKTIGEYKGISGREYDLVDDYMMNDAEAAVVCLGSTAGLAKEVAKEYRSKGHRVGVLKPWLYRPFPEKDFLEKMRNVNAITVLDRAVSYGAPSNALCSDIISLLYKKGADISVDNYVYGLGGRDITPTEIRGVFDETLKRVDKKIRLEEPRFVGVRE